MLFTNARSVITPNIFKPLGNQRSNISMFSTLPTNRMMPTTKVVQPATPDPPRKVKWGTAVWYFFHTSAAKIKPDMFPTVGKELLSHIVAICQNLPCPNCASHASTYMNRINMNSITSKEDLIRFLFVFHNDVNKRLGYAEYEYSELDDKYSKANLINVYNHFIYYFKDNQKLTHLIADGMHRAIFCKKLTAWMSANLNNFEK
jgi:hypothetical protein